MNKLIYPDTENSIYPKTEEKLNPIKEIKNTFNVYSKPIEIVTVETSIVIPKTKVTKKKWILSKVKKFIWLK